MDKYFYSPSKNAWFLGEMRSDYEYHGTWPVDAKEYPASLFAEVVLNKPLDKVMKADQSGAPALFDLPVIAKSKALELIKGDLRKNRVEMLDALTGIAGRAIRAGRPELAQEADNLAGQLLDITDDEALNSANTYEEMQAAGLLAYRRIASLASPELASVFKEITGD